MLWCASIVAVRADCGGIIFGEVWTTRSRCSAFVFFAKKQMSLVPPSLCVLNMPWLLVMILEDGWERMTPSRVIHGWVMRRQGRHGVLKFMSSLLARCVRELEPDLT